MTIIKLFFIDYLYICSSKKDYYENDRDDWYLKIGFSFEI